MPTQSITWQDTLIHKFKMSVSVIILGIVFLNCDQAALWMVLSVRPPVTSFSQCSCHPQSFDTDMQRLFCEARRASHCHSPQTTFSSNSTCCVLSTQKSAMHVVVYADRLTTQHSIVDIVYWSWSYWQFCYPRWHVECFWAALAAHWISSASHTSVLPQHPRRKIVPYRVGWNHHTSDYCG